MTSVSTKKKCGKKRERESEKTRKGDDEQQRESGRKVREAITRYEKNLLETKKGKGVPKIFLCGELENYGTRSSKKW